jgi:hypothetical protein
MGTRPAGASITHSEPPAARTDTYAIGDVMPYDSLQDVFADPVADEIRLGQVSDILRTTLNEGCAADQTVTELATGGPMPQGLNGQTAHSAADPGGTRTHRPPGVPPR